MSLLSGVTRVLFTLIAFATFYVCVLHPRVALPSHLLGHPATFDVDFLSADEFDGLRRLAFSIAARDGLPTNNRDTQFYTPLHEHVGEAVPPRADGSCAHRLLVPTRNGSACVLPGRIDVARHFLRSGGVVGMKERFADAVARLMSFGVYVFDVERDEYAVMRRLFASSRFAASARAVCPPHKPLLDPFQFNFIMQVPGQSVATHLDAVYFHGASRFQLPQWLGVVMKFSGLFEREFVDQIQVVAYLHRWNDTEHLRASDFVYWDANAREPKRVHPYSRAGSIVDGSKSVHSATIYQPHVKAPHVDKDRDVRLFFTGANERWQLRQDNTSVIAEYDEDELRMTLVYRARCFADDAERERFKRDTLDGGNAMRLDDVLRTLAAELVRRGAVASVDDALAMPRIDLASLLLDTFVAYPLPPAAVVPFNYCALSALYPSLAPIVDLMCK